MIDLILEATEDKKEIAFLKAYEKVSKLKAPAPWDYASIEGKHGFTLLALKKKYKICDDAISVTVPKKTSTAPTKVASSTPATKTSRSQTPTKKKAPKKLSKK